MMSDSLVAVDWYTLRIDDRGTLKEQNMGTVNSFRMGSPQTFRGVGGHERFKMYGSSGQLHVKDGERLVVWQRETEGSGGWNEENKVREYK